MKSLKFLVSFSVFTYITSGGDVTSRYELINSVLQNFMCHSVIFISKDISNDINYQKQLNIHNPDRNVYFGSSLTLSMFWEALELGYEGDKKIVVVVEIDDLSFLKLLEEMTKRVDISSFRWLIITQTLNVDDFGNLTIPLSCDFIIAEENFWGFNLTEMYNVDREKKLKKDAGVWSTNDPAARNLKISSEGFFYRRRNLEGGLVTVLASTKDPCVGANFLVGIYSIVECIHFKTWKMMAGILNATTEIITEPELNLDSIVTTDVELTLRLATMNSFDTFSRSFVWPYMKEKIKVYTKFLGTEVEWRTFVRPFDLYMWAAILVWMILCELIMIAVEFIMVNDERQVKPFLNYYRKYSFLSFFAFCNQADSGAPKLLSYRLVYFLIFLVPIFLLPGYSAVLTSFLTVESPKKPFRNLEELSRRKDYRFGWHRFLPIRNLFVKNDSTPTLKALFRNVVLPESEMPQIDSEAVNRMCTEKFAYVSSRHTILALKPKCKFYALDEYMSLIFTTLETKRNSMYLYHLNWCSRLLAYSGLLVKPKMETVLPHLSYEKENESPDKVSPILLENTVLPFVVLVAGSTLSLIILTIEILHSKTKKKFSSEEEQEDKKESNIVRTITLFK